jgi:hypothetical protein
MGKEHKHSRADKNGTFIVLTVRTSTLNTLMDDRRCWKNGFPLSIGDQSTNYLWVLGKQFVLPCAQNVVNVALIICALLPLRRSDITTVLICIVYENSTI